MPTGYHHLACSERCLIHALLHWGTSIAIVNSRWDNP